MLETTFLSYILQAGKHYAYSITMTKSTSETPAQAHRRERKRQMRRLRDNRKITRFRSNATIGKIFPRTSFNRVVREILQDLEVKNGKSEPYLLSYRAGAALQTAAAATVAAVAAVPPASAGPARPTCAATLARSTTSSLNR